MFKKHVSPNQQEVTNPLGCSAEEAVMVEDTMGEHMIRRIFDWQSKTEFRLVAQDVSELLNDEREMFEKCYRKTRQAIDELPKANGAK